MVRRSLTMLGLVFALVVGGAGSAWARTGPRRAHQVIVTWTGASAKIVPPATGGHRQIVEHWR